MVAIATSVVPVYFGGLPLIRDYDIITLGAKFILQRFVENAYTRFFVKAFSVCGHMFVVLYCGAVLLTTFLQLLMRVDAVCKLSYEIFEKQTYVLCLRKNSFVHMLDFWSKPQPSVSVFRQLSFQKCLKIYQVLTILIRLSDFVNHYFLMVTIGMGCLGTIWSGYVMIMCYQEFPLFFYLSCSALFPLNMTILNIIGSMAAIPYKNGQKFKIKWKRALQHKLEIFQLSACTRIGYKIGSFVYVHPTTSLRLSEEIATFVATLCLYRRSLP